MTKHITPATATFIGASGNRLVADVYGEAGAPVLLLHGGGQTRHAWKKAAEAIARTGRVAYALDQRGHGDSEWVESYAFADFAADVRTVADALTKRSGQRPIVIGASLGGMAALLAEGATERTGGEVFSALVLVDITPRVDPVGRRQGHGVHARPCPGRLCVDRRGCRRCCAIPAAPAAAAVA